MLRDFLKQFPETSKYTPLIPFITINSIHSLDINDYYDNNIDKNYRFVIDKHIVVIDPIVKELIGWNSKKYGDIYELVLDIIGEEILVMEYYRAKPDVFLLPLEGKNEEIEKVRNEMINSFSIVTFKNNLERNINDFLEHIFTIKLDCLNVKFFIGNLYHLINQIITKLVNYNILSNSLTTNQILLNYHNNFNITIISPNNFIESIIYSILNLLYKLEYEHYYYKPHINIDDFINPLYSLKNSNFLVSHLPNLYNLYKNYLNKISISIDNNNIINVIIDNKSNRKNFKEGIFWEVREIGREFIVGVETIKKHYFPKKKLLERDYNKLIRDLEGIKGLIEEYFNIWYILENNFRTIIVDEFSKNAYVRDCY